MSNDNNVEDAQHAEAKQVADEQRMAAGLEFAHSLFAGMDIGPGANPDRLSELSLRHLFGDLWQGEDLTKQQRSLITCSMLVALNRTEELLLHFTGAKNLGIPRETIEGLITHSAYYAGWPCAVGAAKSLQQVWPKPE
ncbi:MAG: carboxymuconolactone decarboxylase family protein [Halieaceae bacterium]|nr:carboxymuconolactone decarboxylase family protein [Halieaceae bacterium]